MSTDYRTPIAARAEEFAPPSGLDLIDAHSGEARQSIRWIINQEDAQRIEALLACWNCLTKFPHPLGPENARAWARADFRFPYGEGRGLEAVAAHFCPVCEAPVTSEMLARFVQKPIQNPWLKED